LNINKFRKQQYLEPSLSGIFLAQACLLAKRMGLHQQMEDESGREIGEMDERAKIFRSLYLRDKTNLLSRGLHCWLPSFDCNLSFMKSNTKDTDMTARLNLARLQEDIYQSVYSMDSYRQPERSRNAALEGIEEKLEQWTALYGRPDNTNSSLLVDLKLGFLASRIVALRSSSEIRHKEQVVRDSRTSCQLIAASAELGTGNVLHTRSPSVEFSSSTSFSRSNSSKELQNLPENFGPKPSSRLRSLAEGFSVPAFFGLINNIVWPVVGDDIHGDVKLNSARKISRAFQSLLGIARLLRPELFSQPAHRSASSANPKGASSSIAPALASNFSNNASGILNLSAAFSGSQSSAYSTTNTTRTNTPPFDLLQPLDYGSGTGQYDMTVIPILTRAPQQEAVSCRTHSRII